MIGGDWSKEKKAKSNELLKRGSYRHLLASHQREFYDLVKNSDGRHFGFYCSRKVGKSFTIFIMALEFGQNNPGTTQRIILPNRSQARDIYFDLHQQLRGVIPADLHSKPLKMECTFVMPNGAKIILGGALPENCETLRGPISSRVYRDEVCSWNHSNFDYVTNSILRPQMTTVANAIMIDASTPPRQPNHPWIKHDYPMLQSKGNLVVLNIYKNTLLTPEMVANIIEDYGGIENGNFKREHLCELVADQSLRLVPEFDEAIHVGTNLPFTDNFGNPVVFQSYVGGDLGLIDNSCLLFGYYDHIRDQIIILDEWVANYKSFDVIVQAATAGIANNITGPNFLPPIQVVDIFEIARHTLNVDYGWITNHPSKGRLEEAMSYLRDCVKTGKILINPKCVFLINELNTGIWGDTRTDIKRSEKGKHGDAIMALCYLSKSVIFKRPEDSIPLSFKKFSSRSKR